MVNSIDLDVFSPNSVSDSVSSSSSTSGTNYQQTRTGGFYSLQSMLQMQLTQKLMSGSKLLQTGNPMYDMIITTFLQTFIIGAVGIAMSQLGSIGSSISKTMTNSPGRLYQILRKVCYFIWTKILRQRLRKKYYKNVDIPCISDTKQVNELYKAVFWFLTNSVNVDYLHEPFLQFFFDQKMTLDTAEKVKNNMNIHKILTQRTNKTLIYKNHKITYQLSTELITVYSDKDRKRENFKINISCYIDEFQKEDILESFCQHCITEYLKHLTSDSWVQLVYTNKDSKWESSPSNNTRKIDTIILKDSLKESINNDLQLFLNSEEWYKERDIPYTRGYMFYGLPGGGKTSMIKGMSLYCKRHIHFLMLSEVKSDSELIDLLKNINYKDTILVIEDIDATLSVVKSREETESPNEQEVGQLNDQDLDGFEHFDGLTLEEKMMIQKSRSIQQQQHSSLTKKKEVSRVTLSGLLNAIDGVFSCNGRILIITTNHPEILDSALIRPGRIDSKYLFDNCDRNQIKGLYQMFFNETVDEGLLSNIKDREYSPAHITSVFLRYRNNPSEALLHLDDSETKIVIPKLTDSNYSKN